MKINAQMKYNENIDTETEVASGWVELEDCIKFPVKVRKYVDKADGKEKMFVSYPQRKTEQGYADIVTPNKDMREEINNYILNRVKESVLKSMKTSPITDVKVNLQKEKDNSSTAIRGIASMNLAGIKINGIMIKEGKNGLFVQMPQHKTAGQYRDTVYGTNTIMQVQIKNEILYAYQKEVENIQAQEQTAAVYENQETNQPKEKQEEVQHGPLEADESIELFLAAYESGSLDGMITILENSEIVVERMMGEEYEKSLFASIIADIENQDMLVLQFKNNYDQSKNLPQNDMWKQSIDVHVYQAGNKIVTQQLYERIGKTVSEAAQNYQEMLEQWYTLTHQEKKVMPQKLAKPDVPVSSFKL